MQCIAQIRNALRRGGLKAEAMSLKQAIKLPAIKLYLALSRSLPRPSRLPPNPRDIHKILLMAFGGIGDTIRMIPLIRMLGQAFPAAELATLTNQSPTLFDVAPEGFPACRHLSFDFDHGLASKWRRLRELRRERFDLIVLPIVGDGFVEIAVLARLIGARHRVGFDLDGGGLIYTHSVAFHQDRSILAQYGELLSALGCPGSADNIPFRRDPAIAAAVTIRLQALKLANHQLVVVHPWVGHHERFRAWPPALFRDLIARLIAEPNVAVVLVGSKTEQPLAREHFDGLASPLFRDLTGALTFAETAALLERSRCLVCNDSCLIMVADGLRVPSVAIFGSTAPVQVLAKSSICQAVVTEANLACRPCYLHQTLFAYKCDHEFRCLETVPVERVLQRIRATLAGVAA
jgi:heptosyltransferase-2